MTNFNIKKKHSLCIYNFLVSISVTFAVCRLCDWVDLQHRTVVLDE